MNYDGNLYALELYLSQQEFDGKYVEQAEIAFDKNHEEFIGLLSEFYSKEKLHDKCYEDLILLYVELIKDGKI